MKANEPRMRIIATAGSIGHHHQPLKNAPCVCADQMMFPSKRLAKRPESKHREVKGGEHGGEDLADEGGRDERQKVRKDLLENYAKVAHP